LIVIVTWEFNSPPRDTCLLSIVALRLSCKQKVGGPIPPEGNTYLI
jgi:hypothetical protein